MGRGTLWSDQEVPRKPAPDHRESPLRTVGAEDICDSDVVMAEDSEHFQPEDDGHRDAEGYVVPADEGDGGGQLFVGEEVGVRGLHVRIRSSVPEGIVRVDLHRMTIRGDYYLPGPLVIGRGGSYVSWRSSF